MKRTLLNRRNALLSGAFWRGGAVVLLIALMLLALRFFFPTTLLAVAGPVFRLSNSLDASFGNFFAGFRSAQALAQQNSSLASDNQVLAQENAVLAAKVADLENSFGSETAQPSGVIAGVLARPPEAPYDSLVVAAGSSAGVASGDVAYTDGGIPIGVVAGVSAGVARVTLLSASGEETDAWVGSARTPVTLEGEGGGSFEAKLSRGVSAQAGDAVYVAGPGALPIGTVSALGGDPSSPIVTLSIAGSVNIFSVTYVLIRPAGPSTWPSGGPVATSTAP